MTDLRDQLKKKITDVVMELMDNYDTAPEYTFDALINDFPDLYEHFTDDDILAMCEEVQRSEIPEESARLQSIFEKFNERYFDGRLQGYRIRAVYDINNWVDQELVGGPSSHTDRLKKIIYLRRGAFPLEHLLIHEMAYAVTPDGDEIERKAELRRVEQLGAPVWQGWLTDGAYPIPEAMTAQQVFCE